MSEKLNSNEVIGEYVRKEICNLCGTQRCLMETEDVLRCFRRHMKYSSIYEKISRVMRSEH